MITTIVILSILLSIAGWLAYVQIRKVLKLTAYLELYTRMMLVTTVKVDRAYRRMKEVDRLADDETGMIFSEVKESVTELNEFIKRYINNDDEDGSEDKKKK